MPHSWLGGIRRKLGLSFSLLVATIAVFIVVFFPNRLERQAHRALVARAEAVRDMTAYSLSAGLYFGDTSAIRDVLEGAARDADITLLLVRDAADRLIMRQRGRRSPPVPGTADTADHVFPDDSTYVTSVPVVHGSAPVGTLTLAISLAELRANVGDARRLGVLVGSAILVIGLALVFLVSTLVTRPLLDVVRTAQRIARGDTALRAPMTTDADVSQLVAAVNQMVDSLSGAQAELARINAELEERVQARTAELESLIDLAPAAVVEVDLGWRVTRWNRGATALFGWSAEEVLGQPVPFVADEHQAEFTARQRQLAETGLLPAVDITRKRKDGSPVAIFISSCRLTNMAGHPTGYLSFITDLTERRSLEDRLRQAHKMEALGRLAGGIAHDFNNLLTVITACATLVRQPGLTEEQGDDVDQITLAAERAAALTRQLLTFSRQEVVQPEPLDLNAVIRGMNPMLRRLLPENISIVTPLSGQACSVTADRRHLEQMLLNLAANAADAMPSGGRLSIATQTVSLDDRFAQRHLGVSAGPHVLLQVRDTGVGMDPQTMKNIFDPFFTTKEIGKGTGLGLATVYTVVTQLAGCIDVDSTKGQGTTFSVYLPLDAPIQAVVSPASRVEERPPVAGQETVLLVEDEEPVRRALRRALERLGYAVLDAANGAVGLAVAESHHGTIDIVVTDLMMPGMDGRAFADRLGTLRPDLRVVFISGYSEERVRRDGLVDETHTFLQKPFTGNELGAAIQLLLARTPVARS